MTLSAAQKGRLNELRLCEGNGGVLNLNQRVGTGYDFIVEQDGVEYKVEVKYDGHAAYYESFFVEFQQTFDGGDTWQASGVFLGDCDVVIFSSEHEDYYIESKALLAHMDKDRHTIRRTRLNVNANRDSSFSEGMILPLNEAKELAFCTEPNDLVNYFANC